MKKCGRPRKHDYNKIVRMYLKYKSIRKVASEMDINRRIVQYAPSIEDKKLSTTIQS